MRALGRDADCEVSVRADLAMTGYRGRRIGGGLRAARPTHIGGMPQQARRKFFYFWYCCMGKGNREGNGAEAGGHR